MRSRRLAALVLGLLLGTGAGARAQGRSVVVRDPGPGTVGRRLARTLAVPHMLFPPASVPARLIRDSLYPSSVVVLARDAIIEGRVRGDVMVVGGDAFVHPGASVDGRVVAIGGAAYGSMLASVRGGLESHRDFTFSVAAVAGGYSLSFRALREGEPPAALTLPGIYGLRLPTYDRSDGLSLPLGPLVTLDTGDIEIDPVVTYRSNLGAFDPAVEVRLARGRRTHLIARLGRETFTNDDWIWSDAVNSAAVLGLGTDTRNYYRADRAQVGVSRLWEAATTELEPMFGVRAERAWTVRPGPDATGGPWSFFGRHSKKHMLRPNPPVIAATIRSLLAGGALRWESQGVRATITLESEAGLVSASRPRFLQTTLDGEVRFPTFATQLFWLDAHVVQTGGGPAPPQRWAYLGGSGTIRTLSLLAMGGDQLVYLESNYQIPLQRFAVGLLGAPSVTLRHMIGSAGVGSLPKFEQNLGLRLALSVVRFDVVVDPVRHRTSTGFGLSISR
ncbi:MAG TPA: hypothetical protein VJU87_11610 [Gemmatimonadaceae bacterium]|nr:hypothetical protein [Gemmatimonadaceae bacterium]